MPTLIIAIVSIVLSVAAQFFLKAGMSSDAVRATLEQPQSIRTIFQVLGNKYVFSGFLLYGIGAIIWLGVLSKWDVSKAYPLVGLGFVFTAAIGFLAGEQINATRIIGILLILLGVFLIGRS